MAKQTIDLQAVARLSRIHSGKLKPGSRYKARLAAIMGEDTKRHLFYYKGIFVFIEGETYKTLTEAQAEAKLKQHQDMTVVVSNYPDDLTKLPKILQGRKLEKYQIKSTSDLQELIREKTGLLIPEGDLVLKSRYAKKLAALTRPKARIFAVHFGNPVLDAKVRKFSDAIKSCLSDKDPKQCINNCKNK